MESLKNDVDLRQATEGRQRRWYLRLGKAAVIVSVLAATLGSCGGSPSVATTPSTPVVHGFAVPPVTGHVGRWLTDAHGRVVLLDGVNLVAKGTATPAGEGFGAADVKWLQANGIDAVRLGFTASALMPTPGQVDQAWLSSFVKTVDELTSHGILVLVDMHQDGWGPTLGSDGFPGWMTQTGGATNTHASFPLYYINNPAVQQAFQHFWQDSPGPGGTPLQAQAAAVLGSVASSVSANPRILGYDLLNEPWPGTTWQPCLSPPDGCPSLDASGLDPYFTRAIAAVRAHDSRHLVFPEPYVLFDLGGSGTTVSLPPGEHDGGLSFHMYATSASAEPAVLQHALSWSASTGGALLETEFGATTETGSIDRMISEADQALVPWMFWTFDEDVVHSLSSPPTGTNLIGSTVAALVRPHPVAIAGTPASSSYDPATRTMTASWSTIGPGGRRYPAAAPTLFNVPASVYPSGYRVAVTGGRTLVSGGQSLTVAADPGATVVTVIISPVG